VGDSERRDDGLKVIALDGERGGKAKRSGKSVKKRIVQGVKSWRVS